MHLEVGFFRSYRHQSRWCGPCSFAQTLGGISCRVADRTRQESNLGKRA